MTTPTWTGLDPATKQRFERNMLDITGGVSGGSGLLQQFINRTVQMLSVRELGMLSVLDRRPGSGFAELINRRSGLTITQSAAFVNDTDAALSSNVGTYEQVNFPYRTLATRGYVTRKMQAVGRSYMDILALEMAAKAEDFANALDEHCIYGCLGAGESATNGFIGLASLLENADFASATQSANGNHFVSQSVESGATVAASIAGAYPLTLAALDAAIDKVKGSANRSDLAIIASYAGMRQLNAALQAQQQFVNETEIAAGFRVRTYDGIPMIVDSNVSDVLTFQGTSAGKAGHIKADSGGTGTQFYIINRRFIYLAELTPTTVMPLAKDNSQFDKFDMYWDGAVVLANPFGCAILSNVASDGVRVDGS